MQQRQQAEASEQAAAAEQAMRFFSGVFRLFVEDFDRGQKNMSV